MKRTVPLIITALGGFVLIVAFFIPATEGWGEVAAIWFDILASIAFILGGGNLLKVHLKKISDRQAGWGYSGVTIAAFLITLGVGLLKVGSHPSPDQEHYGETFASLPLSSFPESQAIRMAGALPEKSRHKRLPASVARQLSEENGELVFRGWMLLDQRQDLMAYEDTLAWQCLVERLAEQAQPPPALAGKVAYYPDHQALSFTGMMSELDRDALRGLDAAPQWQSAVDRLFEQSRRQTRLEVGPLPAGIELSNGPVDRVRYDGRRGELVVFGPLSLAERAALAARFPIVKPLTPGDWQAWRRQIESFGSRLTDAQRQAFDKQIAGLWSADQLRQALDAAGQPVEVAKSACRLMEERAGGQQPLEPTEATGTAVSLNARQAAVLEEFSRRAEMTAGELIERLKAEGEFTAGQERALQRFLSQLPTVGAFEKSLALALLRQGPLTTAQREVLFAGARAESAWRQNVDRLFVAAHQPKHPWSGDYSEQGNPFWWIYEYVFKPLTATMFALLAFYVASAAFRAFRAKNVEAILLLGTAFIILLGRTAAGVYLTDWLPEGLAGLRVENLTVYIMNVFNTAGNRAIMIGIALGIASTSLKVLLGVDRSYLGSGQD